MDILRQTLILLNQLCNRAHGGHMIHIIGRPAWAEYPNLISFDFLYFFFLQLLCDFSALFPHCGNCTSISRETFSGHQRFSDVCTTRRSHDTENFCKLRAANENKINNRRAVFDAAHFSALLLFQFYFLRLDRSDCFFLRILESRY